MSWEMVCAYVLGINIDAAYEINPDDLSEQELDEIEEFMDSHEVVEFNGVPHFIEVE